MSDIEDFRDYIKFALENALIDNCPVDKGSLRESISVEFDGDELVVHMLEYGPYIDQGTGIFGPKGKPYEIKPKEKKALSFAKAGGRRVTRGGITKTEFKFGGKTTIADAVVVKRVMHPGIKPFPWIRNTFFHKLPKIIEDAATAVFGDVEVEVSFQ